MSLCFEPGFNLMSLCFEPGFYLMSLCFEPGFNPISLWFEAARHAEPGREFSRMPLIFLPSSTTSRLTSPSPTTELTFLNSLWSMLISQIVRV
ncbi:unnamed protein product [Lota lota]